MTIPFFTSDYSIGKSILTLKPHGESKQNEADSIIDICKNNDIKNLYLVENNLSGYIKAYEVCEDAELNLRFGLKINCADQIDIKDSESINSEHKVIIFANNQAGIERLIKIWSYAANQGFYYKPRVDCDLLRRHWSDDLTLVIPFYDSFIHINNLTLFNCQPNFDFTQPILSTDLNDLPFDHLIETAVVKYALTHKLEMLSVQSIYYKNYDDVMAYMTFRCINKRTTLSKPNLDHFSSNTFCFENWKTITELQDKIFKE